MPQVSEALATSNQLGELWRQVIGSAKTETGIGQTEKVGGVTSTKVYEVLHEFWFCEPSYTVILTLVVPNGIAVPGLGNWLNVTVTQLSE